MNARYEKGSLGSMGNTGIRIKQLRKAADLTQQELTDLIGERIGAKITRGAVSNWESKDGGGISRQNLTAIADIFDVDLNWLERGKGVEPELSNLKSKVPKMGTTYGITTGSAQLASKDEAAAHNALIAGQPVVAARVPIRGRGMGGKLGALVINDSEFLGETGAHPSVVGVPDAFAVYVIDDSMLERYKHGELVYVHPIAPYVTGDEVLIQIQDGEGQPVYGYIRRFISETAKILRVQQLNPKKMLTFQKSSVRSVQKIVGSGSLLASR